MSFFQLTPHIVPANDHPGISASQEVWDALVATLYEALNTFSETYPDLTYRDAIHAAKFLAQDLMHDWAVDAADA